MTKEELIKMTAVWRQNNVGVGMTLQAALAAFGKVIKNRTEVAHAAILHGKTDVVRAMLEESLEIINKTFPGSKEITGA